MIDCLINYGKTFKALVEIKTKANNLGAARSDPEDIYKFTKSYLTTIDHNNPEEVITFVEKLSNVIIFSSINTTNKKDGLEKMVPPR